MKTLTLSIKQKYFDQILAGTKTVDTREVKPTNATKYVYFVDSATNTHYKSWKDIPDGVGDILIEPVSYDALKLQAGSSKVTHPSILKGTHPSNLKGTHPSNLKGTHPSNLKVTNQSRLEETHPSCLVEIKGAEIFFLVDENNEKVFYDEAALEFPAMVIDYQLGAIL